MAKPKPQIAVDGFRHARSMVERGGSVSAAGQVVEEGSRQGSREPLRADQHQGGRDLRLLRLQRIVRRRGGVGHVQTERRRLHQAHARAEVQRQVGSQARAVLTHRPRVHRRSQPAQQRGRRRLQRAAQNVFAGDGRGRESEWCPVRRSLLADVGGGTKRWPNRGEWQ